MAGGGGLGAVTARLRAALTVRPFRGDVVAAGAVALTTAVLVAVARTDGSWSAAGRLALVVPVAALIGALAVLAPPDGPVRRPYHVALQLSALVLLALVLRDAARLLGADRLAQPAVQAWSAAVLAAAAAWLALRRDSAPATLVAAAAGGWAVVSLVDLAVDPADARPLRWPLLALLAVFALGALGRRDRAPRHAAALADAAGLAAAGIAYATLDAGVAAGAGWELVLFAAGFGLLAFGAVDREAVAAGVGGVVLAGAVLVAGLDDADALRWWPLVLAVGGAVLLVVGLRPTTPAPPPPGDDRPDATTVTLPERPPD